MDVTKLNRDQLQRLYEYVQEIKRRRKARKDVYKPNDGQGPVHTSIKQIRAVFSGNGAGKTALGANEAVWAAEGYNPITKQFTPVPAKVIVILDDPDKVEDVWLPEMKKWHDGSRWQELKHGRHYIGDIQFPNGSNVKFQFHQQEPLKFESTEADMVIFDEPPPRHIWIGLRRGGRKRKRQARYLFIGTPLSGSWMRIEIYEPWANGEREDIECFKFGTQVNEKNLSDGYVDSFSRNLSDKEKRIRLHGDFFDLDGLALNHIFKRDTHLISMDTFKATEIIATVCAVDPHPNKNHVAILIGCDDKGQLYYIRELSSKAPPRQFAIELKKFYQGYPLFDIVCDSYGSTPMTGGDGNLSFIEVLQSEGIRVRPTNWEEKKDDEFIMRVQDVLQVPEKEDNFGRKIPKLLIIKDNWGIVSDMENVTWQKIRNEDAYKPKLDIEKRDFLACLKYALATNLSPKKRKAKVYRKVMLPASYGCQKHASRRLIKKLKPKLW